LEPFGDLRRLGATIVDPGKLLGRSSHPESQGGPHDDDDLTLNSAAALQSRFTQTSARQNTPVIDDRQHKSRPF
jgi:hypothetical protein